MNRNLIHRLMTFEKQFKGDVSCKTPFHLMPSEARYLIDQQDKLDKFNSELYKKLAKVRGDQIAIYTKETDFLSDKDIARLNSLMREESNLIEQL